MPASTHRFWLIAAVAAGACAQEVPPASQFSSADVAATSDATDTAPTDAPGADAASGDAVDAGSCPPGQCDDHNPCTTDSCAGTGCVYTPRADGSGCGAWSTCAGGQCQLACGPGTQAVTVSDTAGKATVCAALSPYWGAGPVSPKQWQDQGDGTVGDGLTGLQWQQTPPVDHRTWDDAMAYCDSQLILAGKADWRLPTRVELASLVDFEQHDPAIAAKVFPGTAAAPYWSSSGTLGAPLEAWTVDFQWGFTTSEIKDLKHPVRCVRGMGKPPAANNRYKANAAAGSVLDYWSGLTWQRTLDTSGGSDGKGKRTYMQASGYCDQLSLDGGGWRLPTIVELRGLVDPWRDPPAIDPTAFPAAPADGLWSATERVGTPTDRWYVHFLDGFSDAEDVAELHRVRCVR
ncbi:MAG: DUF1566 domain-containing protein [Deltaproteobacteria bacterium]|nr:DUF1566 domain-containing protein [Deltaproteobacteria bacterium]